MASNNLDRDREAKEDPSQQQERHEPLALPAPPTGEEAQKLDMSTGSAEIKMDRLGPLVVNQDGTLSRIGNWNGMTENERRNTLRVLGKRNQQRLQALKAKESEEQKDR